MFSGSRKIPTLVSTVQWETRQASFPTGTVGPRVGIFLSPLNTNDGFYLSHIPIPASGKDKKKSSRTSIRHVIVMLKLHHYAASQPIQDMMGSKNLSRVCTVFHNSASLVMPIDDHRDRFFYPTLTLRMNSYNILSVKLPT